MNVPLITLKAISLHPPYAGWVADGSKTLETRTWRITPQNDVVICSTKVGKVSGQALCIVDVTGVRPMQPSDEAAARIAYHKELYVHPLENRRVLQPFDVQGRQRIFDLTVPLAWLGEYGAKILARRQEARLF